MADQNGIGSARLTAQLFDAAGDFASGAADVEHHALQVGNKVVDRLPHLIHFIVPFDGNAPGEIGITGRQRVDVGFEHAQTVHQRAQRNNHQHQQHQNHRDLQPGQGLEDGFALAFQQVGVLRNGQQPWRARNRHQKQR